MPWRQQWRWESYQRRWRCLFLILTLWAFGEAVLDVKIAVGGRKDTVLEDRRNLEDLSFRAVGSVVFEGDRGMLRGWKNIYGVFKLLDLSHGSENKKFPDDGSDPVEYPDETGGFLSGELRIPD